VEGSSTPRSGRRRASRFLSRTMATAPDTRLRLWPSASSSPPPGCVMGEVEGASERRGKTTHELEQPTCATRSGPPLRLTVEPGSSCPDRQLLEAVPVEREPADRIARQLQSPIRSIQVSGRPTVSTIAWRFWIAVRQTDWTPQPGRALRRAGRGSDSGRRHPPGRYATRGPTGPKWRPCCPQGTPGRISAGGLRIDAQFSRGYFELNADLAARPTVPAVAQAARLVYFVEPKYT